MKKAVALWMALALLPNMLLGSAALAQEEPKARDWWNSLTPKAPVQEEAKPERGVIKLLNELLKGKPPVPTDADPAVPLGAQDTAAPDDWGGCFPTAIPAQEPTNMDERVRGITEASRGICVEYAHIEGWTVSRGYLDDRYCLIGQKDNSDVRVALTTNDPTSFLPVGDSIIYYGEYTAGKFDWVILDPDDGEPTRLDIGISDEAFFADPQCIWYTTEKAGETRICRMRFMDGRKEILGTTTGGVLTMMKDETVLVYDFDRETVQLFADGEFETIYEGPIEVISSNGTGIWIERDGEYGRLVDGELIDLTPGMIMAGAGTSEQQVFLIAPFPEAETYDVMLYNDAYQAHALVGTVLAEEGASIEIAADSITVWGLEESVVFQIPETDRWVPYGQIDSCGDIADCAAEFPAEDSKAGFELGDFRLMIPMRQDAERQTIALGDLDVEASAWSAAEDPEVSMLVVEAGPLLDVGMNREIEATGTLRHAQLDFLGGQVLGSFGIEKDEAVGIHTGYVRGITALVYALPSDEGKNHMMLLCHEEKLILFAWSAKATTDISDALAIDDDLTQMGETKALFGGKEQSIFLRELTVDTMLVSGLTPLRFMARLEKLNLHNNVIEDLSALEVLYYLSELDLSDNWISDITPLAEVRGLVTLNLAGNFFTDITPLAEMQWLETLDLSRTKVTDLSPLYGLPNLKEVTLLDMPDIARDDVQALVKAMPEIKVNW